MISVYILSSIRPPLAFPGTVSTLATQSSPYGGLLYVAFENGISQHIAVKFVFLSGQEIDLINAMLDIGG